MSSKVKVILANGEVIDDSIVTNGCYELTEVAKPGAPQPDFPANFEFPEKVNKAVVAE